MLAILLLAVPDAPIIAECVVRYARPLLMTSVNRQLVTVITKMIMITMVRSAFGWQPMMILVIYELPFVAGCVVRCTVTKVSSYWL